LITTRQLTKLIMATPKVIIVTGAVSPDSYQSITKTITDHPM